MEGNPFFTTPSPSLEDVSSAASDFQKAYQAALDLSLTTKSEQREKNVILNNLLRQLRNYVNGIALRWKVVYGAKNYVVETSTDGLAFAPIAYPSAANMVVKGLTIGKFYYYRIAANGAAGLGSFSVAYKALAS